MSETLAAESDLAEFLDDIQTDKLRTWQRQRTSEEMGALVTRRLASLEGVEEADFDLAA